ncbi:MAG: alpha/beta hydrolase family protein [Solirubrobacteraceae bacterium]
MGLTSLTLLEPTTSSLANAKTSTGQPARSLPTVIRYPARGNSGRSGGAPVPGAPPQRAAGPFPLVVFSQGYNYPAEGYSALLNAWARAGFVVADPTYPETDPATPGGPNESDIVNHPADLRFVLSALIAAGHRASSPLRGLVKADQIALIGQSDGGNVTLATSANTCCRDPRVKAAVILSGAELAAFGGTYYGSGSPPLLVVQGDADPINVPGCSAALYGQAPVPKYYLELPGASHLAPYVTPGRTRDVVEQSVISFLRYYLERKSAALARLRRVANLPGISTLISTPSLAGRTTFCPGAP